MYRIAFWLAIALNTALALAILYPIETACAQNAGLNAAQTQPINSNPRPAQASTASANSAGTVSLMSNREFWLSCIILLFGIVIILVEYFLLRDVVRERTEEIARTYTVTLIIIGTLVLISSGFTNEDIAPALGLFGTIAGYLLGRADATVRKTDRGEE